MEFEELKEKTSWKVNITLIAIFVSAVNFVRSFLLNSTPASGIDSVFMEWVGWYTATTDAAIYTGIFDIQAPLAYLYPKLLYYFSFGNLTLHHFLNVSTTLSAAVIVVYLIGQITYDYTDNWKAAVIAALVMLSLHQFTLQASMGFRRKIFALMFGLLSIKMYENGREKFSGIFAVLSPAFYAFGVFFSITVFIKMLENRREEFTYFILASSATIIAVLTPVLIEGVLDEMILEAIIVPLSISENKTLLQVMGQAVITLRYPFTFFFTGLIGSILAFKQKKYWVTAGFMFYTYQLFFIDFDSASDAFMLFGFLSISTGLLLAKVPEKIEQVDFNIQKAALLIPALFIVINLGFGGGTGIIMDENYGIGGVLEDNQDKPLPLVPYIGQEAAKLLGYEIDTSSPGNEGQSKIKKFTTDDYWNKNKPGTCHYRWGSSETAWVERFNINKTGTICGQYPEKYHPSILEKIPEIIKNNPNFPKEYEN